MTSEECCTLPSMLKLKSDIAKIAKLFVVQQGRCEFVKTPHGRMRV